MKGVAFKCTEINGLQSPIPGATEIVYARGARDVDPGPVRGRIDWLIFYGSHGNFQYGEPTMLNGLDYDAAKLLVAKLLSLEVMANTIVLDCCFSAGFIPLLTPLLVTNVAKPSTILCHIGSASGSLAGLIDQNRSIPIRTAAKEKVIALNDFTTYVSLAVYIHGNKKNLYRKTYTDIIQASECYIDLIGGSSYESGDIMRLEQYLTEEDINVIPVGFDMLTAIINNAVI